MRCALLFISMFVLSSVAVLAQTEEDLLKSLMDAQPAERASIMNQLANFYLNNNKPDVAVTQAINAALLANEYNLKDQLALALHYRGEALTIMRRVNESEQYLRQALELYHELNDLNGTGKILGLLSQVNHRRGQFDTSIEYGIQAIQIWEQLNDTRSIIHVLSNLSYVYMERGTPEIAIKELERAENLHNLVLPHETFPSLYHQLSRIHFRMGSTNQAEKYGLIHKEQAEKSGNKLALFEANNNLASIASQKSDFEKAFEYLTVSLELSKELGMGAAEGVVLNNIGNNFSRQSEYERAISFYRLALKRLTEVNHTTGRIGAANNIGRMFQELSLPDSARVYHELALQISEVVQFPINIAQSLAHLGNINRLTGRVIEAESQLIRAREIAISISSVVEQGIATKSLARLYLQTGRLTESEGFALEALELNRQRQRTAGIENTLKLLSDIYEAMGRFELSLKYFKQFSTLKDSVASVNRIEQITALQEQLNLELKEREIENANLLLAQQALIVSRTQERFTFLAVVSVLIILILLSWFRWYRLNQSREKLLMEQKYIETEHRLLRSQMNPHFMFNALNSIQLFISEKDSLQAERYLSKFAHLMRYYLDSSFTSNVLLKEEMDGLNLNIELEHLRMNKSFEYEVIADEHLEPEETEIPPMLAQPFIENAIKHGLRTKAEGGKLRVEFSQLQEDVMKCVIEDNGIGRTAAAALKKSSNGHHSRGIEITKSRLKNIWKEDFKEEYLSIIDLKNTSDEPIGTRVELLFPLYN